MLEGKDKELFDDDSGGLAHYAIQYSYYNSRKKLLEDEIEILKKKFYKYADDVFNALDDQLVGGAPKSLDLFEDNTKVCVTRVKRQKVVYDAGALFNALKHLKRAGNLTRKQASEACRAQYVIFDYDGFTKLCKKAGITPEELKLYVKSEKTVNVKALDNLKECGYIEDTDLLGTYKTIDDTIYYRATIKDGKKNE